METIINHPNPKRKFKQGDGVKQFRILIRRGSDWKVKKDAEEVDGKVYMFGTGWKITAADSGIYVGETAMIPFDENWPDSAPTWIASGDLVEVGGAADLKMVMEAK